jgi:hypothetical protein
MKSLNDLPKHMRTKKWILSEIKYESFEGVRTVHKCDCNCGNYCRSIMCVECWKKLLKRVK